MRLLILSDLHSNQEALDAVLADARRRGFDRAVCLGDLVGYGANPNEVVATVRELDPIAIRGNHDKVIAGVEDGEQFNLMAVQSCRWTQTTLTAENLEYLRRCPRARSSRSTTCGSPTGRRSMRTPTSSTTSTRSRCSRAFPSRICFFGHSHIPTIFSFDEQDGFYLFSPMEDEERLALKPGSRYLVNCGSVGQPRDRNPKAAYGIYSTSTRVLEPLPRRVRGRGGAAEDRGDAPAPLPGRAPRVRGLGATEDPCLTRFTVTTKIRGFSTITRDHGPPAGRPTSRKVAVSRWL